MEMATAIFTRENKEVFRHLLTPGVKGLFCQEAESMKDEKSSLTDDLMRQECYKICQFRTPQFYKVF